MASNSDQKASEVADLEPIDEFVQAMEQLILEEDSTADPTSAEGACEMMAARYAVAQMYGPDLSVLKSFVGIPWLHHLHEDSTELGDDDLDTFFTGLPERERPRMESILGFAIDSDQWMDATIEELVSAVQEYLTMLEADESLIEDVLESENDNDDKKKKPKKRVIDTDAIAANVSQRQRVLANMYNEIMSAQDEKGRVAHFDEVFLKSALGVTYDATFFSYSKGEVLHEDPVQGYFSISIEPHSPNFTLFISNEKEVAALRRATSEGVVPDPKKEEPEGNKEKREWKNILGNAFARATQIKARIGYEALVLHKYVIIRDLDEFVSTNKTLAKHFSDAMKEHVRRLLSCKEACPVYYEVKFNLDAVAQDKLFLGRPEWANAFGDAFKDGMICCILDGSKEAVRRLHFVGELMDDQKAYGSRLQQLWLNDANTRRLVLRPDNVRTEPRSGQVSNATYKYQSQLPNYNWDEAAIKMAVSIGQERSTLQNQKTAFENESHTIILFKIPGTHEGHLLGFIDWPLNDSTLLTPDTQLRLTFVEHEKKVGATDAGQAPEKENEKGTTEGDSGTEKKHDAAALAHAAALSVNETTSGDDIVSQDAAAPDAVAEVVTPKPAPTPETAPATAPVSVDSPSGKTLVPARDEYKADFPYDGGILETDSGPLNAIFALVDSIGKQCSVDAPTPDELMDDVKDFIVDRKDLTIEVRANQLLQVLDTWYMGAHQKHAQLGILQMEDPEAETGEPNLVYTEHREALRVWVCYIDGQWRGLEPLTEEEHQAVRRDRDQDADAQFLVEQQEQEIADKTVFWRCRITPPVPNGPVNKIPVIVTRPWDKEKQAFDDRPLRIIDTDTAAEYDFRRLVHEAPSHQVKLQVIDSARQSKRNFTSLELLNFAPKDKPFTRHNEVARQLLTCNNLHEIKARDAFTSIRSEFPNPEAVMILNQEQKQAILAAAEAPGGTMIISGVPGAGKSHIAYQILKPFLMSADNHSILMTSNSNEAADNLVRGAWATYTKLVAEGKAPAGRRILRLYSNTSEKVIRTRHLKAQLGRDPESRPEVEEVEVEQLSNLDAVVRHLFDSTRKHKYDGIYDSRVQDIDFSLGQALLTETGIVHDPIFTPANAQDIYEDFRRRFNQYHGTKEMNKDQRKEHATQEREILKGILANAAVIVCTVYTAGSRIVTDAISSKLTGIIIDEAFHELTTNLLPVLSMRAPKVDFVAYLGDPNQLAPPALFSRKELPFASEHYLPLPSRLQKLGFPVSRLLEQSRMVPEIASLSNRLVYKGEMRNMLARCGLRTREAAREFRKWVPTNFSSNGKAKEKAKPSNVVWLDTIGKPTSTEKHGSSKINYYQAIAAANLVPKLLRLGKNTTVCLMTTHAPQRNLLLSAVASMELDPWVKGSGLDRLSVGTVDALIGKEYNYVVLSLLVDNGAGFLSDLRRLCVALTRARDGLIIFLSGKTVAKLDLRDGSYLKDLITFLQPYRVEDVHKSMPNCRWITPPSASVSSWTENDVIMAEASAEGGQDWETAPAEAAPITSGDDQGWGASTESTAVAVSAVVDAWETATAAVPAVADAWESSMEQNEILVAGDAWEAQSAPMIAYVDSPFEGQIEPNVFEFNPDFDDVEEDNLAYDGDGTW
ncbi:hypothetical protein G647_06427 [Cladophialophora carrionii CBS 160.54]|uniref:AAA+ ATPase domain-containing protein n=1 Tax=Cladophialophora carrionii CBS 160.54 TaxID=1279043 RepID=V9D7R9_9EURO|nr:uncharacterized protein G647_06427 [Cladophialophora carrionii CBS 160.54]ETI22353.1 hypothetical protein G647_06427 [Cladophialophora carrionii CBS 160.54]